MTLGKTILRTAPLWRTLLVWLPFSLIQSGGCNPIGANGAVDGLPDDWWDTEDEEDGGNDPDGGPDGIITVRDCVSHLTFTPGGSPGQVQVGGEWNEYDETQASMVPQGDGSWTYDIELSPGYYAYKYVIDGTWEDTVPADVYTQWSGEYENRSLRVGDCMIPLLQTVSAVATASGTLKAEIQFATAADEVPIDPSSVEVTVGGSTVTPDVDDSTGEISISTTGLAAGKHTVRVWAADTQGRRAENEPLFVPLWVEEDPFEWWDAVMYLIFTDRFRDGDGVSDQVGGVEAGANYLGGDYLGVLDTLDQGYFEDLGANLLWLSPHYQNPDDGYGGSDGHQYSGYHGYWPTDPLEPEDKLGDSGSSSEDRLKELIDEAHSRGIRVLFDLVLNHVHEDHTYVTDYSEWFAGGGCVCGETDCDWDSHALDCWFRDYLPDLNYRNHEIVVQITDDVLELARRYDVDAFRIDAAKHMDHVIMRTLSMRLRDEMESGGGAPFYLVGETYVFTDGHGQIMDYVADYELDAQFDFPLVWTLRDTFTGSAGFDDLEAAVAAGEAAYGDAPMSPFLGNHDILRFATLAAENDSGDPWSPPADLMDSGSSIEQWDIINRMSMGFAFLLTQKGVPLIYYGDEIGLAGSGDPDNRRMMHFDPSLTANQEELLQRVQAIGQARQDSEALRRGDRTQLWADANLYVYARTTADGEAAIIAMNKADSSRVESVVIPGDLGLDGDTLNDAIGGGSLSVIGGSATIDLGGWQYAIYLK